MNDTSKSKDQQTDCKCSEEIKTGWTEIQCCNICGKSLEPFWRVEQQREEPWVRGDDLVDALKIIIRRFKNGTLSISDMTRAETAIKKYKNDPSI